MIKYKELDLGYRVLLLLSSLAILNIRQDYMRTDKSVLLVLIAILFIAIFNTHLPYLIGLLWRKLGDTLNVFISPIILVVIYFLIFVPISLISRYFAKQNPFKSDSKQTSFLSNEKMFDGNDLKNMW